jgi:hypothetical protein
VFTEQQGLVECENSEWPRWLCSSNLPQRGRTKNCSGNIDDILLFRKQLLILNLKASYCEHEPHFTVLRVLLNCSQVEVVKDVEHFESSEDVSPKALQIRVDAFDLAYKNIEKKAAKREANLLNAIRFFNFKSQCDRCKFWLSERQRDLLSIKSTNENR